MLTVWRRLHIEVDSMGEANGNFEVGNFAETKTIAKETNVMVNTSQQRGLNQID